MANRKSLLGPAVFLVASLICHSASADGNSIPKSAADSMCAGAQTDAQQLQCWYNATKILEAKLQAEEEAKAVEDATGQSQLSDTARQLTVPNVELVYGDTQKTLNAVLVYSDGRSLTVHPGEQVPGDFTVESIVVNPPSVTLDHDGQPLVLLMGGEGSSLQSKPPAPATGPVAQGPMIFSPPIAQQPPRPVLGMQPHN